MNRAIIIMDNKPRLYLINFLCLSLTLGGVMMVMIGVAILFLCGSIMQVIYNEVLGIYFVFFGLSEMIWKRR